MPPKALAIRNGSVTVKVYPAKRPSGQAWSVCWYEDGARRKAQRSTLAEARKLAEDKAEKLNDGNVGAMAISQDERLAFAQARSLLIPTGRTVAQVAADYADALKALATLRFLEVEK